MKGPFGEDEGVFACVEGCDFFGEEVVLDFDPRRLLLVSEMRVSLFSAGRREFCFEVDDDDDGTVPPPPPPPIVDELLVKLIVVGVVDTDPVVVVDEESFSDVDVSFELFNIDEEEDDLIFEFILP